MNLDPSSMSNILLIFTAFSAAFVAALWLSLLFWTYRDIRNREKDPLIHVLAVLVVAVLFLPGIIIYLILRPKRTIEEEYQSALEEEALLQSIESGNNCPGCGKLMNNEWTFCPYCHQKIKKVCRKCNNLVALEWDICPYCGIIINTSDESTGDSSILKIDENQSKQYNTVHPSDGTDRIKVSE